ncbi:MAG: GTP-binding protein [Pseudomonas sp.]|nr:GTP-binding protein [Pseudomonas sp.]
MNNVNRSIRFKPFRPLWSVLSSALLIGAAVLGFSLSGVSKAETANGTQTLVFLRHAEKPEQGLGQLNCQGLNRAIALSSLLPERFGKADFIFAADPSRHVEEGDHDQSYNYLRPLMTIGPSAIKLGLPINTDFAANDTGDLAEELLRDKYHSATVYTAWSHGYLPELINEIIQDASGSPKSVIDDWASNDFDSLYVLTLVWHDGKASVSHKSYKQELNNESVSCPV